MHDADQDRVGCDCPAQVVRVDPPCAVDRQSRHRRAQAFQETERLHDCRMLDAGCDEVGAWPFAAEEHALQG
jgi:hypothetical protein